jgi:hypothetical protein
MSSRAGLNAVEKRKIYCQGWKLSKFSGRPDPSLVIRVTELSVIFGHMEKGVTVDDFKALSKT